MGKSGLLAESSLQLDALINVAGDIILVKAFGSSFLWMCVSLALFNTLVNELSYFKII